MALFILYYFGYHKHLVSKPREIITIYPEQGKTKIKPLESGGIVIPNSEATIYDGLQQRGGIGRKVNLLPEPEQPINITAQRVSKQMTEDSIDVIIANILSPAEKKPVEVGQAPEILELQEPKTAPNLITPQNKSLKIIKVAEKTTKVTSTNNIAAGNYKIQLASVRSEADGVKEYERIKRKHLKILSNTTMSLRRVQYNKGNFFYLVLAGNYRNISQAKAVCKKLSSRQQSCIVANY